MARSPSYRGYGSSRPAGVVSSFSSAATSGPSMTLSTVASLWLWRVWPQTRGGGDWLREVGGGLEDDPGLADECEGGLIPVDEFQCRVVVAAGQRAHECHGIGSDARRWLAGAYGPRAAGAAGEVQRDRRGW